MNEREINSSLIRDGSRIFYFLFFVGGGGGAQQNYVRTRTHITGAKHEVPYDRGA